jgi:hypothetical protein
MKARRIILWAVAVGAVVAAVVLLSDPLSAVARRDTPGSGFGGVTLNGPVESASCAPCHLKIAEVRKPGLIFNHGNHLQVACTGCHVGNPHAGGGAVPPPMETCFNCHGVSHGPQGDLATGACADCHPKSFDLRPANHGRSWAGKPHAQRAKAGGTNGCMMCHDAPKDCDVCHRAKAPKVKPIDGAYHPILRVKPAEPAIKMYPDKPTSMGQCIYCHPDVDRFMPGRIIFEHAEHLKRNFQCTACHPTFGHDTAGKPKRPDMASCYRCHGLQHGAQGSVATEDCGKCHPKGFDLKPPDHTRQFAMEGHAKRAVKDGAYCAMCHRIDFCNECHNGKRPLADGSAPRKVIPKDHKKAAWRGQHGQQFLAQKGMCASCHTADSCETCHKTPMPHPPGWLANHNSSGISHEDCNVCHTNRDSCQQCHHDKVKRAELVEKNCTPCHKEMKKKPAVSIKNKGFVEHAVHFDTYKKKGKPYTCDDCHVDFGSSKAASQLEKQQGHDLRLCYGCHGALDYENRQIAPWPGAELCRRCHSDLNI